MNESQNFEFASSPVLLIKEGRGKYRAATAKEILDASGKAIDEVYARGEAFQTGEQARAYFVAKLTRYEYEVFAVAWLDTRHRLIAYVELYRGSIAEASVFQREIVKSALRYNAGAAIIAHNHPSGIPEPSRTDVELTKKVRDSLKIIDVRLLDHIVVGGNLTTSLAERGDI